MVRSRPFEPSIPISLWWSWSNIHRSKCQFNNRRLTAGLKSWAISRASALTRPREECRTGTEAAAATAVQHAVNKQGAAVTQWLQLIHSGPGRGARKSWLTRWRPSCPTRSSTPWLNTSRRRRAASLAGAPCIWQRRSTSVDRWSADIHLQIIVRIKYVFHPNCEQFSKTVKTQT